MGREGAAGAAVRMSARPPNSDTCGLPRETDRMPQCQISTRCSDSGAHRLVVGWQQRVVGQAGVVLGLADQQPSACCMYHDVAVCGNGG